MSSVTTSLLSFSSSCYATFLSPMSRNSELPITKKLLRLISTAPRLGLSLHPPKTSNHAPAASGRTITL